MHTETLVGKPEEKRPFGRARCRWENNIRMDLQEIGWEGVDWMHLAQDRDQWQALVNTVYTFQFHKRLEISGPAERLPAFEGALGSVVTSLRPK
jgi:hypothetical protein